MKRLPTTDYLHSKARKLLRTKDFFTTFDLKRELNLKTHNIDYYTEALDIPFTYQKVIGKGGNSPRCYDKQYAFIFVFVSYIDAILNRQELLALVTMYYTMNSKQEEDGSN